MGLFDTEPSGAPFISPVDFSLEEAALPSRDEFPFVEGASIDLVRDPLSPEASLQILEKLESLRDRIMPEGEVTEEDRAAITFSLSEPQDITRRPILFERFSRTFIIEGRKDFGCFKCFGGLTAPANAWFDFMMKLYDRAGIHTEVYPLKGQNGNWKDFSTTTFDQMVNDILEKTSPEDVVFTHSTSGAAAFEAWRRKPGFCRAIVAIGAPLYLNDKKLEDRMDEVMAGYRYRFAGKLDLLRLAYVPYPRRDNPYSRRVPQFTKMAVSTSIEFRKAQLAGLSAIQELPFPPLFYAQGSDDAVISPAVRELMASPIVRSAYKVVPQPYEGGDHSPQYGPTQKLLLRDIGNFLRRMYIREGYKTHLIPEFQKRTGALDRFDSDHDFFVEPQARERSPYVSLLGLRYLFSGLSHLSR